MMQRIVTAIILAALALTLILVPALKIGFGLFITVLAVLAGLEFLGMVRLKDLKIHEASVLFGIAIMNLGATFMDPWIGILNALLVLSLLIFVAAQLFRAHQSLTGFAAGAFALLYVGWMPAHVMLIHRTDGGVGNLLIIIIAVVFADTGAYFAGKTFGHHKLAPTISPKKTWEGLAGGLAACVIAMFVLHMFRHRMGWELFPDWPLLMYACVGLLLGIVSVMGDLLESLFKRDVGVKDSGTLLPGHGGILDRCDGLLLAVPTFVYLDVFIARVIMVMF